jgi:hypothetical protein
MKLKIAIVGMALLVGSFVFSIGQQKQGEAGFNLDGGGNPEPICLPPERCFPAGRVINR